MFNIKFERWYNTWFYIFIKSVLSFIDLCIEIYQEMIRNKKNIISIKISINRIKRTKHDIEEIKSLNKKS